MRRRDGGAGRISGAGEQVPSFRQPAPGKSGPRAGAAPGCPARNLAYGWRRGSARGRYPPARSWLTEADPASEGCGGRAGPKGRTAAYPKGPSVPKSAARRRKENAAAERREAPRWAIPLGSRAIPRQALPRGGPRVRRSAPAPVGALPPHFFRGRKKDKGQPGALLQTGR